jgi:hypothetical protein
MQAIPSFATGPISYGHLSSGVFCGVLGRVARWCNQLGNFVVDRVRCSRVENLKTGTPTELGKLQSLSCSVPLGRLQF